MIIKCPQCGNMYNLRQKPSKEFCCPSCKYKAPFKQVIDYSLHAGESVTKADVPETAVVDNTEKTRIATNMVGDKTMLVPGLQQKKASLQISYKGVGMGSVALPPTGNFILGRRSSDSKAQVKIAPDMTMSRMHAAMRVMKGPDGGPSYQITTIKSDNPVYVNGQEIGKGKICVLKNGDKIRLGETDLVFRLG